MKNKSKLLALLLAVCMCVGLLAGCGDNAASAGSNAPASAPEAAAGSDVAEGVETSASNDGTLGCCCDRIREQVLSLLRSKC